MSCAYVCTVCHRQNLLHRLSLCLQSHRSKRRHASTASYSRQTTRNDSTGQDKAKEARDARKLRDLYNHEFNSMEDDFLDRMLAGRKFGLGPYSRQRHDDDLHTSQPPSTSSTPASKRSTVSSSVRAPPAKTDFLRKVLEKGNKKSILDQPRAGDKVKKSVSIRADRPFHERYVKHPREEILRAFVDECKLHPGPLRPSNNSRMRTLNNSRFLIHRLVLNRGLRSEKDEIPEMPAWVAFEMLDRRGVPYQSSRVFWAILRSYRDLSVALKTSPVSGTTHSGEVHHSRAAVLQLSRLASNLALLWSRAAVLAVQEERNEAQEPYGTRFGSVRQYMQRSNNAWNVLYDSAMARKGQTRHRSQQQLELLFPDSEADGRVVAAIVSYALVRESQDRGAVQVGTRQHDTGPFLQFVERLMRQISVPHYLDTYDKEFITGAPEDQTWIVDLIRKHTSSDGVAGLRLAPAEAPRAVAAQAELSRPDEMVTKPETESIAESNEEVSSTTGKAAIDNPASMDSLANQNALDQSTVASNVSDEAPIINVDALKNRLSRWLPLFKEQRRKAEASAALTEVSEDRPLARANEDATSTLVAQVSAESPVVQRDEAVNTNTSLKEPPVTPSLRQNEAAASRLSGKELSNMSEAQDEKVLDRVPSPHELTSTPEAKRAGEEEQTLESSSQTIQASSHIDADQSLDSSNAENPTSIDNPLSLRNAGDSAKSSSQASEASSTITAAEKSAKQLAPSEEHHYRSPLAAFAATKKVDTTTPETKSWWQKFRSIDTLVSDYLATLKVPPSEASPPTEGPSPLRIEQLRKAQNLREEEVKLAQQKRKAEQAQRVEEARRRDAEEAQRRVEARTAQQKRDKEEQERKILNEEANRIRELQARYRVMNQRVDIAARNADANALEDAWQEAESLQLFHLQTLSGTTSTTPLPHSPPIDGRQLLYTIFEKFLHGFIRLRRPRRALVVWNTLHSRGLHSTPSMWLGMMHGFGQMRDLKAIDAFWGLMLEAKIVPDAKLWNARIVALVHTRSNTDVALVAWQQQLRQWVLAARDVLQKRSSTPITMADVVAMGDLPGNPKPTIEAFNAVVSSLARRRQQQELETFISTAHTIGLESDVFTYNARLKYALVDSDEAAVHGILGEMAHHGVNPDVATFTMLLESIFRGAGKDTTTEQTSERASAARELLATSAQYGVQPNAKTYGTVITGLLKDGSGSGGVSHSTPNAANVHAAYAVVRHMTATDVPPDAFVYTALITHHFAIGSQTDITAVETLVTHAFAQQKGFRPDSAFFDRLIEGYARAELPANVRKTLALAGRHKSVTIGWTALRSAVVVLHNAGDAGAVEELLAEVQREEMSEGKKRPRMGKKWFLETIEEMGRYRVEGLAASHRLGEFQEGEVVEQEEDSNGQTAVTEPDGLEDTEGTFAGGIVVEEEVQQREVEPMGEEMDEMEDEVEWEVQAFAPNVPGVAGDANRPAKKPIRKARSR